MRFYYALCGDKNGKKSHLKIAEKFRYSLIVDISGQGCAQAEAFDRAARPHRVAQKGVMIA